MSPAAGSRSSAAAARRRARSQEILAATRRLFDETGVRDAQIEEIAQAVGVNRAIIYRHFSGKEELFALTMVSYLDELESRLKAAADKRGKAITRLSSVVEAFVDYGLEYPAFVDCAQTLMSRSGPELLDELSEGAMFKLGRGIAACLKQIVDILDVGMTSGEFRTSDSAMLANHMYASGLGALQLARVGMVVKEAAPGVPMVTPLSTAQVKKYIIATARALATS